MGAPELSWIAWSASARKTASFSSAVDAKPFDVFVFHVGPLQLVGTKTPARRWPATGAPLHKGCLIEPVMIAGALEQVQLNGPEYQVSYFPLNPEEISVAFRAADVTCDLLFPLRRLVTGRETAQPPAYWDGRASNPDSLDGDEVVLREAVAELLAERLTGGQVVYDPACSSGAFLAFLKQRFPGIRAVGQDRSAAMIAIARTRVDECHLGDSLRPLCRLETADVVICRHLNLDVVTSDEAKGLFCAAARALRPEGWMIVLGHTPVLVSSVWMEAQGFQALARCDFTPSRHAVFQLYLLRRSPAKHLRPGL
jgi:isonocardicin synthase